jgi:hypothetical protein
MKRRLHSYQNTTLDTSDAALGGCRESTSHLILLLKQVIKNNDSVILGGKNCLQIFMEICQFMSVICFESYTVVKNKLWSCGL